MEKWSAYINSSVQGPFNSQEIIKLITDASISGESLLLPEGGKNWIALKTIPDFAIIAEKVFQDNGGVLNEQVNNTASVEHQTLSQPVSPVIPRLETQQSNSTVINQPASASVSAFSEEQKTNTR